MLQYELQVPSSGVGPPTNISQIEGPKFALITAIESGTCIILGSIDGTTYVPLVSFSSQNPSRLKTFAHQVSSVRVERLMATRGGVPRIVVGGTNGVFSG